MKEILKQMEVFLVKSGIPETRILSLNKRIDKLEKKLINPEIISSFDNQKIYNELKVRIYDIYLHEYREVKEIWDLVPESQWALYKIMNLGQSREQLLLKTALSNLKIFFIERVLNYGKKEKSRKESNSEDSKRSSDQPGSTGTAIDSSQNG